MPKSLDMDAKAFQKGTQTAPWDGGGLHEHARGASGHRLSRASALDHTRKTKKAAECDTNKEYTKGKKKGKKKNYGQKPIPEIQGAKQSRTTSGGVSCPRLRVPLAARREQDSPLSGTEGQFKVAKYKENRATKKKGKKKEGKKKKKKRRKGRKKKEQKKKRKKRKKKKTAIKRKKKENRWIYVERQNIPETRRVQLREQ